MTFLRLRIPEQIILVCMQKFIDHQVLHQKYLASYLEIFLFVHKIEVRVFFSCNEIEREICSLYLFSPKYEYNFQPTSDTFYLISIKVTKSFIKVYSEKATKLETVLLFFCITDSSLGSAHLVTNTNPECQQLVLPYMM